MKNQGQRVWRGYQEDMQDFLRNLKGQAGKNKKEVRKGLLFFIATAIIVGLGIGVCFL